MPKNVTRVTFDVIFLFERNLMRPNISRQTGFSLIEAIMVVAIVALVAAVAVPSLMGSKDAAEKAAIVVGLRSMHTDEIAFHTTRAAAAENTSCLRLTLMDTSEGVPDPRLSRAKHVFKHPEAHFLRRI